MIRITITGPAVQPVIDDLKSLSPRIITACRGAVKKSLDQIQQVSRSQYLSGPRPVRLGVVTGNLRRSVRSTLQGGSNELTGVILSDTPYSHYHELGFHGRRKARAVAGRRKLSSKGGIVNYAGRPFLGPAFREEIPNLTRNIVSALDKLK